MGAADTAKAIAKAIKDNQKDIALKLDSKCTGCQGLCEKGPLVLIEPEGLAYYGVKPKDADAVVKSIGGEPVKHLLFQEKDGSRDFTRAENTFYASQKRLALELVGKIDPGDIDDYLRYDGYKALAKALEMKSEEIIEEVIASGLRGRGGAGFPTGIKWKTAFSYDSFPKYVVCNGDEGNPGAFMDGSLMEGNPHAIIEGLAIAALAIDASQGFLYIRDEYHLALKNIKAAIASAEARGIIGKNVLGSGRKISLGVVRGGGAFVCGESTALMRSIEGKAGEPTAKYIRSVQSGLWGQPTVLNNVETLANIPRIILDGGAAFADIGSKESGGCKIFSLAGETERTGLIEVPMGTPLKHIIYDIGGGVKDGRPFKAVQTGGPSGGFIPENLLDLPVDFDTFSAHGTMMGAGGMLVMDDRDCMVEIARYYVDFLSQESCGQCTPCREGLRLMLKILTDITEGKGRDDDIELLETLSQTMEDASLCALGKSAPTPVLSSIQNFREEYKAHIKEHRCPAGVCAALTTPTIDTNKRKVAK
jgi:NADH-quinone oxidoreductase subunit F